MFYLLEQKSDSTYNRSHYLLREFYANNELAEPADNLDLHQPALNNHTQNNLPLKARTQK